MASELEQPFSEMDLIDIEQQPLLLQMLKLRWSVRVMHQLDLRTGKVNTGSHTEGP